jgi:hypothetical protein
VKSLLVGAGVTEKDIELHFKEYYPEDDKEVNPEDYRGSLELGDLPPYAKHLGNLNEMAVDNPNKVETMTEVTETNAGATKSQKKEVKSKSEDTAADDDLDLG